MPDLIDRLAQLMFISPEEEKKIESIMEEIWKFNQTYTLAVDGGKAEDQEPYWYIRDEFGSAIEHSDRPNVRMAPFLSMIDRQMYTLLWLIEDIPAQGSDQCLTLHFIVSLSLESVTVDYVCGIRDPLTRRAKLVPWIDDDLAEDVDYQQEEPSEEYFKVGSTSLSSLSRRNQLLDGKRERKSSLVGELSLD